MEIGILDQDKRTAPVDVGRFVEGRWAGIASPCEIEIVEINKARCMQIDADKVGLIEQAAGYEGLTRGVVEIQYWPLPGGTGGPGFIDADINVTSTRSAPGPAPSSANRWRRIGLEMPGITAAKDEAISSLGVSMALSHCCNCVKRRSVESVFKDMDGLSKSFKDMEFPYNKGLFSGSTS